MNAGREWNVVLLGDTRDLHHHGCEAVLGRLIDGLRAKDMPPTKIIPGLDWTVARQDCLEADAVIVNGEGSLHHDRPAVGALADLADARRERGSPTALVNASWFANGVENTRRLAAFDLVAVRDPQSRAHLRDCGIRCLEAPDLAVQEALRYFHPDTSPQGPPVVSDSTKPGMTRELRRLARTRGWTYLPVLYPPDRARASAKSRKIFAKTRLARALGPFARLWMSPRYHAHAVGAPDVPAYLAALQDAPGVLTGRFHTVCFCLGLGVPFLAVASNTPKIESILQDAGLDPAGRMVPPSALAGLEQIPPFSERERRALQDFRHRAAREFDSLFESIRALLPRA